jgi:hypothetical protein
VPVDSHPDPDERFAILQREIMEAVGKGWTVEGQWPPDRAILSKPASVNHVAHAILSLLTCGLWLIVWLLLALNSEPERRMLYVDQFGEVQVSVAGFPGALPLK